MAGVTVLRHVERRRRVRPLRWLQVVLGLVLILAGVIAFAPAVVVVVIAALSFTAGSGLSEVIEPALWSALVLVVGVVVWRLGAGMVRGRVHTVLFLRKFNASGPREFVRHAASKALGRQWRLVTLDDLAINPVSARPWQRNGLRIVSVIAAIALAWLVWQLYAWLDTGFEDAVDEAVDDAENPLDAIGIAFGVGLALGLVTILFVSLVALATALGFFINVGNRSLRRAERDARMRITTEGELHQVIDRVEARHRKFFSPRIAVVRVTDALWKQAIDRLAGISDVALIDISDPTENLVWELQMLGHRPDVDVVLVGEAAAVQQIIGSPDPVDRQLLAALGTSEVVVYDADRDAFATSLRNRLARAT